MSEFHTFRHEQGGDRVIKANYTGNIEVRNAWIEEAFEEMLDDCRDGRNYGKVDNQRLLAFIIEQFGDEIIEAAQDTDAETMLERDIRAIEDKGVDNNPEDILDDLQTEHVDKSPEELKKAKEAFEETLQEGGD